MAYTARTIPDPELTKFPPGIPYIIGNEGCERFSFYGMRAILYVYVVGLFVNLKGLAPEVARAEATATTHLFFAAVYALPLVGAMVADRLLGKYRTILWLSVVYCAGHAALALFEDPALQQSMFGQVFVDTINGLYIGLGLIAVGSGGIKPCVSAHVGDQFGKGNWHLLQKVYNAFYFIINFGSAFATILIPLIRGKVITDPVTGFMTYEHSVGWAFGVPGILMGLATIFFWMGRKTFVHVPATQPFKLGLMDVLAGTFLFLVIGVPIFFLDMVGAWSGYLNEQVVHCGSVAWPMLIQAVGPLGIGMASWAVIVTALGCFVAFVLIYAARQRIHPDDGFLALTFQALKARVLREDFGPGEAPKSAHVQDLRDHWLYGPVARKHSSALAEGPLAVWKIISVFLLISVFWALFDQHSSTWIEQAKSMNLVVDLSFGGFLGAGAGLGVIVGLAIGLSAARLKGGVAGGMLMGLGVGVGLGWLAYEFGPYELQPSQISAANPFMVMILIPLTTFGLCPLMARLGISPHPLRRMTMGMATAGLAFVAVALLQSAIDGGAKLHVGWQLIPYTIITLSEVMVSITGLEFAYSQAPKRMKSVIMGFWLFNVTLGNLLVALIARLPDMPPEKFFWIFAVLMFVAAALFGLRGKFYRYKEFTQDDAEAVG